MAERTNPHANLIIGAQDEASPVFEQVGASAKRMADAVKGASEQAAKSSKQFNEELKGSKNEMRGLSDPAVPAAQTFDKATSSMIRQVQRLNAELEAGGARNAAYFEKMASVKGADMSALAPYLADLKKAEAAQRVATTGLDQMGMSAKQTSAALRQVPMQFTDIVVSLQGGQSAMQVFLQQGGQLKDMFGGAGNAVRAMGGYVAGLVNPFTLAAAAIATIAVAYKQGSAEADGYRMALVTTGNAAGTTAAQMQQMAGRISSVVGTQGAAAEALAQMASSGRVASQSLEYFSEVAIKFERTTGTAISETVKRFAELGASPVDASRKLNEETNYLTASIYEQIKALKDQGREADAAALAQNTYADALNNRSAQITQNLGAIEGAWKAIKDAAKSGWDAMLNVGRADSLGTQIDSMRAKIAQAKGQDKNRPFSMPWDTSLADLEKQLSFLTEQERVIRRGAEAQAQRTQAEKEAIAATDALQKTQASGMTNQQKMNKALEEYARHIEKLKATNPASVLLSPDAIARGEKAIRDQFSDKGKGSAGIKAVNKDLADQQRIYAELAGVSSTYHKELAAAQEQRAKGNVSEAQYVAYVNDLIQKQPFAVALAKEEAAATQATSKAYAEAAAERIKTIQSMERAADGLQSQNDALREEIELIGLSAAQQTQVLQQRNEAIILTKEATLAELERQSAITGTQTRVEIALASEIEALKERNALLGAKAGKNAAQDLEKANAEAAKKAQEDWERASEQINNTLTDALMRGFESGKDFAKNLRDTVVNMFKTMVLRPVISAVVNPVAGAITGALGLAGTANAGTSALGAIGTGASILNAGSALGGLGAVGGAIQGFATAATASVQSLLGMSGTVAQMTTSLAAAGHTAAAGVSAGANAFSSIPGWGWAIAGAAALWKPLFGRKLKDTGIEGTLGGEAGFEGQQYRFYKGGLFRSDKTKYSAIDPELERMLAGSFGAVQDRVTDFAEALSLPTDRIKGFTTDIKVSFKGLDEAGIQKALQDALATGSNELAQQVLGSWTTVTREITETLAGGMGDGTMQTVTRTIEETTYAASEYAREGEKAIDTLSRLATSLSGVNTIWGQLGNTLLDASLAGADAASRIADAFGGLEAMAQATGAYFQNFYSAEEQRAAVERQLNEALGKLNLQLPDIDATDARAQYRALAEAQDRNTEAGREAYVVLLQLSGAFASVTQAAGRAVDAASLERKDRLAAQRAQEKQAAEALQKQIEAYAEGAEQFNTLRDSLLKAGDAAGLLAAVTERAFADPSGKYMNGRYELPRWESTDTAASFNYKYGEMQARMRAQAYADASANALRVQNVSGLMGAFSVEQMMSEYDPVTGPIKLAIQQAIVDASGDLGYAVRDAVSGVAMYAAMQQVRDQFSVAAPGLASVAAARVSAADASRSSYDTATGMYRIGGAAVEYGQALESLQAYMRSGAISVETFERAVDALDATLPGAAQSLGTLEDVIAAVERASFDVGTAGLNSIRYYFGSLSDLTAEFAKAAAEAQEPIAQTTAAIGRLNSAQSAFGGSAAAALEGFGGGGVGGAWMLQDAGVMKDITRAQLIAEAAGIASAAMTTADAAAAAAKLAQSPAFAELTAQGIRDASLLLDGVGQYNADGFERAFLRISDALAKGNVTDAQYKALFDVALDMFEGVPEETRTLIDSMTRLRDAMSGFADGLLIDEQRTTLTAGATLAEMQRQYAQAFAGASTGDNEAIGKYQQLATTLLDKDLYSTRAEYNAAFGSVYGDARQLENIGINTLANAQGDAMVSELKDMNAKLNKRVEDLEKNLLAALAQIAKNTSDTSRGIEQQIVIAEDTP